VANPSQVTDTRSNPKDQIAHAADVIGRSTHRRDVFKFVYRGQKRYKTVSDIAKALGLSQIRVLDAGKALHDNGLVTRMKIGGEAAFGKDQFYRQQRAKILALVASPKKLKAYPTKTNPGITVRLPKIVLPKAFFVRVQQITVDGIESFEKVKKVSPTSVEVKPMLEKKFKKGIKKIVGEKGKFQDWGGEKNDLFTTRMKIGGKRVPTAFAFKGRGMKGKRLTPKLMGKNGDQIQRLFASEAAGVYLIQYWRQIDESIIEQMKALATARSATERRKVYFGVIDGVDSARIIQAYAKAFK
jgi:hypothetical protein